MRHHTTDLAERTADIANREADQEWEEKMKASYPYDRLSYGIIWLRINRAAMREFQPLPEPLLE